jgi:hypothetical protein
MLPRKAAGPRVPDTLDEADNEDIDALGLAPEDRSAYDVRVPKTESERVRACIKAEDAKRLRAFHVPCG